MAIAEEEVMQEEQIAPGPVRKRGPRKQAEAAPAPVVASEQPMDFGAPPAAGQRGFRIPGYVWWMLLSVVLLVGGVWVVVNPWIITDNIDHPYALLFGPALVVSVLALWLTVKFFEVIEKSIRSSLAAFKAARARDEAAQFFWMVIAVFLAVSVFASGDFFAKLEREAIPGLGYATAFVIDLVAVVCMRARLNAGRMRNRSGQTLYLVGVVVCACASAFANLYTTLTTFDTSVTGHLPQWMAEVAPWFGMVFPGLIVLLSLTADYALDQTSSKLDPESYKREEGKRVTLLGYQRDLLRERVQIEREIDDLAGQLRGRKERRVFFLVAWLFPRQQVAGKQLLKQVEALYQPQLAGLIQQNELLLRQNEALGESFGHLQESYGVLFQAFQDLRGALSDQRESDNRLTAERLEGVAEQLRSDLAALTPMEMIERLQEEMRSMVSASQVDALTSTLRQEIREMAATKTKVNHADLARSLAPLLARQKGLREVIGEVVDEVVGRSGSDTEELPVVMSEGNEEDEVEEDEVNLDASEAEKAAWLQQPSVSIKQAAAIIGCDAKYIRTLRDRRSLKATPRNKSLIDVDSLKAYQAKRLAKV